MIKKVVVWSLVLIWSLLGMAANFSYAQVYTEADMKAVTVRFCGEGTWASSHDGVVYVEPWKESVVRLCVTNAWEKKVQFQYGFSVSKNDKGRVCYSDISTGNEFSVLIPQTKSRTITIDPMSEQIIEENVVIPPGMSWAQLGCLMYKLLKPEHMLVGGMFNLEINKYGYLDIVVGWESDVKSSIELLPMDWGVFSTNNKVKAQIDEENNITLQFAIKNDWNVSQNIQITGIITNMLGFQQVFSIPSKIISPWTENEIIGDVGVLPSYKWFYTIKFFVQSDPQFLFKILNEELKKPWYITENAKIFIFSWIRVIIVILLTLFMYKIIVPKKVKSEKK